MGLDYLFSANRLITLIIMILTSMPIHEWAHAFAAYRLGDDTAALRGRLTLNPLAHLDLVGTLGLIFVGYGWGKPVPVSPHRLRGNMRASWALVSAAGPFSNLVLAMLAAIPFRMGWLYGSSALVDTLQEILANFIIINLSLMLFNLIPIPPLDGSRILAWLLPRRWAELLYRVERVGGIGLFMLLFLLSRTGILALILDPLFELMIRALLL